MSKVAIDVVSISKVYSSGEREIQALKDVNVRISVSDFVTISGPSGAGKTTLLNIIGGLDRPTSGEVFVLGLNLNELSEGELAAFRCVNIGYVFQDYNLISTLTAMENIEFARELAGFRGADFEAEALELISAIGLAERVDHLPDQLSGGERQRLAFARALANDPAMVLADEPTGNLDDETALGILDILLRLKREGKTVVVATHDARIWEVADRRFRMSRGTVVEEGW